MNKKGYGAFEYLMDYGWALVAIAIVVGVLVFIVSPPPEAEHWEEEWTCTPDGWQETGELVNCMENFKEYEYQQINSTNGILPTCPNNWEPIDCGEEYIDNVLCAGCYGEDFCTQGCRKEITEIVCDREKKCVQQTKTRCLTTQTKCKEIYENPHKELPKECYGEDILTGLTTYKENHTVETCECDEANK